MIKKFDTEKELTAWAIEACIDFKLNLVCTPIVKDVYFPQDFYWGVMTNDDYEVVLSVIALLSKSYTITFVVETE